MNQMISAFTLAALVAAISSVATQTVPSFAGKWSLVSDANVPGTSAGAGSSKGLGNMGSGWGADITIRQDAATLTIEYARFPERDLQRATTLVYHLDGSESRSTLLMARGVQEQVSTTAWKDRQFVIKTRHRFENPGSREPLTSETVQVLSLETPTSLVVETTRSAVMGGRSSTTRAVYARK